MRTEPYDYEFENESKPHETELILFCNDRTFLTPIITDVVQDIVGTLRKPYYSPHILQGLSFDRMLCRTVNGSLEIVLIGDQGSRTLFHCGGDVLSMGILQPKPHKKSVVPIIRSLSEQRLAARFITVLRRTTMTYKGLYTTFSQTHGLTCNSAKSYITRAVNVGIIHKTGDGYSMA